MSARHSYFRLLRAALWGRHDSIHETIYWKHVLTIAKSQSTMQLICQAALRNHADEINDLYKEKMQKYLMRGANAHASANRAIAQICTALGEVGIRPVLLKGQGLASYYKIPELRQCGDIDLYVGRDGYAKACEVLSQITGQQGVEGGKHCSFDMGGGLEVELHQYTEVLKGRRNAYYQSISDKGTSQGLVPVMLHGVEVMTPENTFNAFYIFHHMWHHTIGMGIGMRQLCDWGVFLHTHKDSIDTAELKRWLRHMGLMDVWKVYAWAVASALHIPVKELPFATKRVRRRAHRLIDYIIEEGDNRSFKFERGGKTLKRKLDTLKYILRKTGRLFPIFPAKAIGYLFSSVFGGVRGLMK